MTPFSKSNYWLITGSFKNKKIKNIVLKNLRSKGFMCRTVWRPLHLLKIYKHHPKDNLKNSLEIFEKSLNFTSSPSISYKNK